MGHQPRVSFFRLLKGWLRVWIRSDRLALVFLLVFYCVSIIQVMASRFSDRGGEDEEEIVIRFCHWQLETSVREGFDWLAEEYRKVHPNVRVRQMGVGGNGGAYNQWITTQLLGKTAPDLVEIPGLHYPIMITFCSRYFVPLSAMTSRPNPFNQGTELEDVPLRETFIDNLQCAYVAELQDYYGLPMTLVNCRMYYNTKLYKKLTGLDEPPADLRSFLEVCKTIKQQKDPMGRPYIPIAGSQFSYSVLRSWVMTPLSHRALYLVDGAMDEHCDGYVSQDELFFAWAKGLITLRENPFRLSHQAMHKVVSQFQSGWNAMDRDRSLFMFAQQRAVFIPTGTWDYRSLATQAGFELGVFEIPVPSFDDPEFGDTVAGPVFERPQADARFALNKNSKHLEEATEFLLWFMSQKTNQAFCAKIGWLPSIRGARIPPEMIPFQARMNGVIGPLDLSMGNQTNVIYNQQLQSYMLGKISYDELIDVYEADLQELGTRDFVERTEDIRRSIFSREATTVQMRGRMLSSTDPVKVERLRKKYYEFTCDQMGIPGYVLHRKRCLEDLGKEPTPEQPQQPLTKTTDKEQKHT
jgi:raffinose/stachyose/melibiose transport system substrate-binding protein